MPSTVSRELGINFEAKGLLEAYKIHPDAYIDDLARIENLWFGVMPSGPRNTIYDKGFFGRLQGLSGASIDPKERWTRSSSPEMGLWQGLQILSKSLLQTHPVGGVGVSILSDLAALEEEQRKAWGAQLLAHDPGRAANVARQVAETRRVMEHFATIYPDDRVRHGAKLWIQDVVDHFERLALPLAGEATPEQLAAVAPTQKLKEQVLAAATDEAGDMVSKAEFEAKVNAIAMDLESTVSQLKEEFKPLFDAVAAAHDEKDAKEYAVAVEKAKAWASFGGQLLAIAGAPALGQKFSVGMTAGIDLTSSIKALKKQFSKDETIDPLALTSGVGAALAICSMFQESGPSADDVIIGMLGQVMDKLGAIQDQLRQTHVLVADLYSFVGSFKVSITNAIAELKGDVQALTLLYEEVERAKLYEKLKQDAEAGMGALASRTEIEAKLISLSVAALSTGSIPIHTHGPGSPYKQYTESISDIFRFPHAEAFAGVLADSAAELADAYNWLKIDWTADPDESAVPVKQRFGNVKEMGHAISPVVLTYVLARFRDVLDAHPEHEPPESTGLALTSLDHYRRLIRATVWMHHLYLETNTLEVVQAALLRVHVLYSELAHCVLKAHREYIAGQTVTPYANQISPDVLFGQEPYITDDWIEYAFRRLQTLYRMGLVEENYLASGKPLDPWAVCFWKLKKTGQRIAGISAQAPAANSPAWNTWGCADALASITEGQPVRARLEEILQLHKATFTGITWFEPGLGPNYREYVNWKPNAESDPPFVASMPAATAAEARKWASESISRAFSGSLMQAKLDELKRACVQAAVIFKNVFPNRTHAALPKALAILIDRLGDGFGLANSDSSDFFGQEFLLKFQDPVLQRARLAIGPPVTTAHYDVLSLIVDGALDAEKPEERQRRWRDIAQLFGPKELGGFGSSTSQSALDRELSYQVSQALKLHGAVPSIS